MRALALVAALLLTGCSLAPTDKVIAQKAEVMRAIGEDKASWCFHDTLQGWGASLSHTWMRVGEGQAGGTCVGMMFNAPAPVGMGQTGGAIILPAQPRILQQEAPTYREIVPGPPATRGPMIRPQSAPGAQWRGWDVLETSAGYQR